MRWHLENMKAVPKATCTQRTEPFGSGVKPPPLRYYCALGQRWEDFQPRLTKRGWGCREAMMQPPPSHASPGTREFALGLSSNPNTVIQGSAQSRALIAPWCEANPSANKTTRVRTLQNPKGDATPGIRAGSLPGFVPTQIPP